MRVTVTQLSDSVPEDEWIHLVSHARDSKTELVLLGEMPFDRWLPATDEVDLGRWREAVDRHGSWIERLGELGPVTVASSRPALVGGIPHNEGFVWSAGEGYRAIHTKYYLPNEPGFWEGSWYRRSPEKQFEATSLQAATGGMMLCTDLWFTEHARGYAAQGADLILVPRATEADTTDKWLVGGRAAAVMSGSYCLSSNRQGTSGSQLFGGTAWVIDPEGDVLATTSEHEPFVTLDLDLARARTAKGTYPRYVAE